MVLNCPKPLRKKRRCAARPKARAQVDTQLSGPSLEPAATADTKHRHLELVKESSSSCGPPVLGCYGIANGSVENQELQATRKKKKRGESKKLTGDQRAKRKEESLADARPCVLNQVPPSRRCMVHLKATSEGSLENKG